jgi:hypothetical protein
MIGEETGNWQWDGERWRSVSPGGSMNPGPCPPPSDGTVGPAFIEITMDNVTLLYDTFAPLCQLMLTPGDWDVWGNANQEANPLFIAKNYEALIWNSANLAAGSPDANALTTNRNGRTAFVMSGTEEIQAFGFGLGPMRWLVSAPTPVYLLLYCAPGVEVTSTTFVANGYLGARRYGPWSARSAQPPAFEVYRGPGARVQGGFGEG